MELDVCGQIPADWDVTTIEDVCERVTSGGTPSRARPEYYCDGKWGWVKTQELRDAWIDQTEERITDEAIEKSSAKVLPANTVLLALYGATVGQLGILRRSMTCNQACCAMIVDPRKADFRYVYHQLRLARPQLRSLATGAAQQNLSGALMKSLRLPLPPLAEQQRIAHILGTLDDKIELNRRMNATLEGISRALFKSWFVDFDPVRQKAAGQQPVGMDAQTAALFPDSFEESEIGEVPKGWRVGRLDDSIVLQRGFDLPAHSRVNGEYPILAAGGLNGFHNAFMVRGPGVTTGRSGVLGNVFYVHEDFWPLNTSLWVKEYKASTPLHAYHVLSQIDFRVFNAGSAVPTLNRNHVHSLPIARADMSAIKAFDATVRPVFQAIRERERESRTLAALRDTLLPKLLSGEIRVPEAERAVEEAIA